MKKFENISFLDIFIISPLKRIEEYLTMSPGFIMSGGVQAIHVVSTCGPNTTIKGEWKCCPVYVRTSGLALLYPVDGRVIMYDCVLCKFIYD